EKLFLVPDSLLRLGSQWRNPAVGRINNERRTRASLQRRITEPMVVIGARHILLGAGRVAGITAGELRLGGQLLLCRSDFFFRQKFSGAEFLRTFQRNDVRIAPDTLKIRISPGSSRPLCRERQ